MGSFNSKPSSVPAPSGIAEKGTIESADRTKTNQDHPHPQSSLDRVRNAHHPPLSSSTTSRKASIRGGGLATKSLEELGFEFRFTPCGKHSKVANATPSTSTAIDDDPNTPLSSLARSVECGECATRLYRNDTLVTHDVIDELIPKGRFFDHVSTLCQRETQTKIVQDSPLELITIYETTQALVSRDLLCALSDEKDGTVSLSQSDEAQSANDSAATDDAIQETSATRRCRPTLIIMAGKGISRAGLLSVKQLLTLGMERGSAVYHIQEALKRRWHVIVLDPNAKGPRSGMDVVTKSLDVLLFYDQRPESISNRVGDKIYFLCHSASGGYLVRYLLDQDKHFQRRVAAIAFSDSTHRLSWAQQKHRKQQQPNDVGYLHDFLQSDRALYIRNNSLGRDYPFPPHQQPQPGQVAELDHWWIHRYGRLPTVWAGTSDHSLVCWVARKVIWAFFDGKKDLLDCHEKDDEGGGNSNDNNDDGDGGCGPPKNPLEGFSPI